MSRFFLKIILYESNSYFPIKAHDKVESYISLRNHLECILKSEKKLFSITLHEYIKSNYNLFP